MAQKTSNIKSILTPNQAKFLKIVSESESLTKKFYLTGGAALSEFYLHRRDSEDIDLFSEEEFNLAPIQSFVKKAEKEMKAGGVEFREFLGLKTFFLKFKGGATLKIDFNYYPFPRIEKGAQFGKLEVDSIFDIAVNKIHTRPTA